MTDDFAPGVQLLSQPFEAGPYTFAATPEGWYVQGAYPQGVTIAPEGVDLNPSPYSFEGKLVIMLDGHQPFGEPVTFAGREFWVRGDSGYTTIETLTRTGEPEGKLSVQYPDDSGWTQDTMLEFLATRAGRPGCSAGRRLTRPAGNFGVVPSSGRCNPRHLRIPGRPGIPTTHYAATAITTRARSAGSSQARAARARR